MNTEFTIEQIRSFVAKGYNSVAARMTKSLLKHYDMLDSNTNNHQTEKKRCEHGDWIYGENRRKLCGKPNCIHTEEY